MSGHDRMRWNASYRMRRSHAPVSGGMRGAEIPSPSASLRTLDPLLPREGRAIDVAGGAGRNAIWLARRGLAVTVVDIADEGLALARRAARLAEVSIATEALDLEANALPTGRWNLILCVHYLSRPLYRTFAANLFAEGVVVIIQPTVRNLERHPRPSARYLLAEGELPTLVPGLTVVSYEEGWRADEGGDSSRHEAVLVARLS